MSRKHYEAAAQAIAEQRVVFASSDDVQQALDNLTYRLGQMFRSDNRRFDMRKFKDAAGVQDASGFMS